MIVHQASAPVIQPRWIAPSPNLPKINVDAAVLRNEQRGVAAPICWDDNGQYLGVSAVLFNAITDLAILESLACGEALALAEDLNRHRIHVALDCKTVVSDISDGSSGRYGSIVEEIKARSRILEKCSFVFEGRASNSEAHNLARYSVNLGVKQKAKGLTLN
jgi:hypothetical protein